MSIWDSVGIVIRSIRERIITLDSYELPKRARVVIVTTKERLEAHQDFYGRLRNVMVTIGPHRGLGGSAYDCYDAAIAAHMPRFFRLDDELPARFFIGLNRASLELEPVIRVFNAAMNQLGTSLVGPVNSSRRDWFHPKYIRSYAGINGAAILVETPRRNDIKFFIEPSLRHFDDIFESCSHRSHRGAVGRVGFVGINKIASTGPDNSTVTIRKKTVMEAVKEITSMFPQFVHVDGWSEYTTRGVTWKTPHWVFTRHGAFSSGSITLRKKDCL